LGDLIADTVHSNVPTEKTAVKNQKLMQSITWAATTRSKKGAANANNSYETTCQIIQWQPNKQEQETIK